MKLFIQNLLVLFSTVLVGQASAQSIQVDAKSSTLNPSWGGVPGPTIDVSGFSGGLEITASGSWCGRPNDCSGPSGGQNSTGTGPAPGCPRNSLLGQWEGAVSPYIIYIGTGATVPVPPGATSLRLFFNDDANAYGNNTGTVSVTAKPVSPFLDVWSYPSGLYGEVNHHAFGFTPYSRVVFVWSRTGVGSTLLRNRRVIDLARPVRAIGKADVDRYGYAYLPVDLYWLPRSYVYQIRGRRIWIQCYEVTPKKMTTVRKSNVVEEFIW